MLSGFTSRPPPEMFIANYVSKYKVGGAGSQAGTAKRVHLTALYTPRSFQSFEIGAGITTLSAGANIRLGIYQQPDPTYFPESPAGADLLYQSGNISTATTGLKQHTIPNIPIKAGMFWMALETEDATMAYRRLATTVVDNTDDIFGCYYDLGSFGALTNPCPAVSYDDTANFVTYAVVKVDTWG